jgi:hypothetical protein
MMTAMFLCKFGAAVPAPLPTGTAPPPAVREKPHGKALSPTFSTLLECAEAADKYRALNTNEPIVCVGAYAQNLLYQWFFAPVASVQD